MNIKKEVYDEIIKHLGKQVSIVTGKIKVNARDIEYLASKQRGLKKQRNELMKLISIVQVDKQPKPK